MSTEPANTRGLIGSWRLRMLLQLLRSLQRTWPDFRGCTYDPASNTLDITIDGVEPQCLGARRMR